LRRETENVFRNEPFKTIFFLFFFSETSSLFFLEAMIMCSEKRYFNLLSLVRRAISNNGVVEENVLYNFGLKLVESPLERTWATL